MIFLCIFVFIFYILVTRAYLHIYRKNDIIPVLLATENIFNVTFVDEIYMLFLSYLTFIFYHFRSTLTFPV